MKKVQEHFEKELCCDVVFDFGIEFQHIFAHKMILSAFSPRFEHNFRGWDNYESNGKSNITVEQTEIYSAFLAMIKYFYYGTVDFDNLEAEDLPYLKMLAKEYDVKYLGNIVAIYTERLNSLDQ